MSERLHSMVLRGKKPSEDAITVEVKPKRGRGRPRKDAPRNRSFHIDADANTGKVVIVMGDRKETQEVESPARTVHKSRRSFYRDVYSSDESDSSVSSTESVILKNLEQKLQTISEAVHSLKQKRELKKKRKHDKMSRLKRLEDLSVNIGRISAEVEERIRQESTPLVNHEERRLEESRISPNQRDEAPRSRLRSLPARNYREEPGSPDSARLVIDESRVTEDNSIPVENAGGENQEGDEVPINSTSWDAGVTESDVERALSGLSGIDLPPWSDSSVPSTPLKPSGQESSLTNQKPASPTKVLTQSPFKVPQLIDKRKSLENPERNDLSIEDEIVNISQQLCDREISNSSNQEQNPEKNSEEVSRELLDQEDSPLTPENIIPSSISPGKILKQTRLDLFFKNRPKRLEKVQKNPVAPEPQSQDIFDMEIQGGDLRREKSSSDHGYSSQSEVIPSPREKESSDGESSADEQIAENLVSLDSDSDDFFTSKRKELIKKSSTVNLEAEDDPVVVLENIPENAVDEESSGDEVVAEISDDFLATKRKTGISEAAVEQRQEGNQQSTSNPDENTPDESSGDEEAPENCIPIESDSDNDFTAPTRNSISPVVTLGASQDIIMTDGENQGQSPDPEPAEVADDLLRSKGIDQSQDLFSQSPKPSQQEVIENREEEKNETNTVQVEKADSTSENVNEPMDDEEEESDIAHIKKLLAMKKKQSTNRVETEIPKEEEFEAKREDTLKSPETDSSSDSDSSTETPLTRVSKEQVLVQEKLSQDSSSDSSFETSTREKVTHEEHSAKRKITVQTESSSNSDDSSNVRSKTDFSELAALGEPKDKFDNSETDILENWDSDADSEPELQIIASQKKEKNFAPSSSDDFTSEEEDDKFFGLDSRNIAHHTPSEADSESEDVIEEKRKKNKSRMKIKYQSFDPDFHKEEILSDVCPKDEDSFLMVTLPEGVSSFTKEPGEEESVVFKTPGEIRMKRRKKKKEGDKEGNDTSDRQGPDEELTSDKNSEPLVQEETSAEGVRQKEKKNSIEDQISEPECKENEEKVARKGKKSKKNPPEIVKDIGGEISESNEAVSSTTDDIPKTKKKKKEKKEIEEAGEEDVSPAGEKNDLRGDDDDQTKKTKKSREKSSREEEPRKTKKKGEKRKHDDSIDKKNKKKKKDTETALLTCDIELNPLPEHFLNDLAAIKPHSKIRKGQTNLLVESSHERKNKPKKSLMEDGVNFIPLENSSSTKFGAVPLNALPAGREMSAADFKERRLFGQGAGRISTKQFLAVKAKKKFL